MTGEDAVELCGLLDPTTIVPTHYEGWKHFRQPPDEAHRALDESALADRVHWLEAGVANEIPV
jgi:L-ascorbate metabolism protein UlaG (beta-lactamase superfamily)